MKIKIDEEEKKEIRLIHSTHKFEIYGSTNFRMLQLAESIEICYFNVKIYNILIINCFEYNLGKAKERKRFFNFPCLLYCHT